MIEPSETNIREVSPTSRRSLASSGAAGVTGRLSRWVATVISASLRWCPSGNAAVRFAGARPGYARPSAADTRSALRASRRRREHAAAAEVPASRLAPALLRARAVRDQLLRLARARE